MSDTLVKVDAVSKKFCRDLKQSLWYGLQDVGRGLLGIDHSRTALREGEFWAVRDVSFELKRGECLGLIGRNGAGKSTLLRMLNGLILPDTGRIEMRGRVGALIDLGAGFKPILSGRENIYLAASLFGLSKREIDEKVDEIIEFSELEGFIDMPVCNYSTGMKVRLGFSINSIVLNPDILILDEVLAVGDAAFRSKCYQAISVARKNSAVIFVSHNMEQISRISNQVLVLDSGKPVSLGVVEEAVQKYITLNQSSINIDDSFLQVQAPIDEFGVVIKKQVIRSGCELEVILEISSLEAIDDFVIKALIYNLSGGYAADGTWNSADLGVTLNRGTNSISLTIPSVALRNGKYYMAFNVLNKSGDILIWSYKEHKIQVYGAFTGALSDYQLALK